MRTRKGVEVPEPLARALRESPDRLAEFERMPPSHQRRYAEWVAEAKKDETREKRAAESLGMIAAWAAERPARKA